MALRVIGAGLGRTGTMSMKLALEQLGFGPCFHMVEFMMDFSRLPAWEGAASGAPDWDAAFEGFAATVDYPGCTFWRELAEHYPSAKVLLTVRDPDAWFESARSTIFSDMSRQRIGNSPLEGFFRKAVWGPFGDRTNDRDFMVEAFERHNAEVERAIPPERLLVYETGAGWEPLCEFFEVPVPNTPFPRANTREEWARRATAMKPGDEQPLALDEMSEQVKQRFAEMRDRHWVPKS